MTTLPCPVLARPNVFEVDLEAIAQCTRQIRALIGPKAHFTATLKANAYGYGVLPVANTVLRAGADALSVVDLDDAIALRNSGIECPILVYAGVLPTADSVRAIEKHKLIATIHSEESLQAYLELTSSQLNVAIKVDVGAERIGVPASTAADFIQRVANEPALRIALVNAHPNLPAGADASCLDWQFQQFLRVCKQIADRKIRIPHRVFASSRVLRLRGACRELNAVDPGDALFSPLQPHDGLCPFKALNSRLIQVRQVERDAYLDEAPFPIRPDMRVGIIPMGYSDGLHRLHAGLVLVNGRRAPIVGKPALEYSRIDLSQHPEAKVGDMVTIIGSQDKQHIQPAEVAQFQGVARVADLAMQIGKRVRRRYLPETEE